MKELGNALKFLGLLGVGLTILLTPIADKWLWAVAVLFVFANDD